MTRQKPITNAPENVKIGVRSSAHSQTACEHMNVLCERLWLSPVSMDTSMTTIVQETRFGKNHPVQGKGLSTSC